MATIIKRPKGAKWVQLDIGKMGVELFSDLFTSGKDCPEGKRYYYMKGKDGKTYRISNPNVNNGNLIFYVDSSEASKG